MFWIIIASFVVLMGLAIAIYLMPTDSPKKKKEKRPEPLPDAAEAAKQKDWQAIAHRWEKQNNGLFGDIEKLRTDVKKASADAEVLKSQNKELSEKLALEKGWREKEQATLDKFKVHEKGFKDQITHIEKDLEKEHSSRIHIERELQETKVKFEQAVEEKRQLGVKASSLQTTVDQLSKELQELKREYATLKAKREDAQWVAKSEFDDLKLLLKSKEQELARLKPPS